MTRFPDGEIKIFGANNTRFTHESVTLHVFYCLFNL